MIELPGQESGSKAGRIIPKYLRGGVRTTLTAVMAAEVAELRGLK